MCVHLHVFLGALASVRRDQLSMFIAPARRSMDSFFFRFYMLTGKFDAVSLARRCRSLVAVGVSAVYGLWNSLQTPPRPVTRAAPRRTRTFQRAQFSQRTERLPGRSKQPLEHSQQVSESE